MYIDVWVYNPLNNLVRRVTMPDPKDYMDDNHEFVRGYVRSKSGETTIVRKRRSWFWRIAWYWRLLIVFAVPIIIVAVVIKYPFILLTLIVPFIFWLAISGTRRKRKQGKPLDRKRKVDLF